jgi:metal-sulfur cluster biosynthetic enzyme
MNEKTKEAMMEALEEVKDPELGIDIVNLGLVYDVELTEEGTAIVTMTMTSIGCPLAGAITEDVKKALLPLPDVKDVEVSITFNPPWSKDRMSRYAKIALGIH